MGRWKLSTMGRHGYVNLFEAIQYKQCKIEEVVRSNSAEVLRLSEHAWHRCGTEDEEMLIVDLFSAPYCSH